MNLDIVFLSYEHRFFFSYGTSHNKFYFLIQTSFSNGINAISRIDTGINIRSIPQKFLRIRGGYFYHAVCFLLCIKMRMNRLTVELKRFCHDFKVKSIVANYFVTYFLSLFVRFLLELVLGRSKQENSIFHFEVFYYLFRMPF